MKSSTLEQLLLKQKDEALLNVRAEMREHFSVVVERERALSEAAIAQQQKLEQQCAGLREQIEALRRNFAASEQALLRQKEEALRDVRAKMLERFDVALEYERTLSQKAAISQQEWEQRCTELQERIEANLKDFLMREHLLHSETDKIISDIRAETHEREQALTKAIASQQEAHGLAVATLAKSQQEYFDEMQIVIKEEKEKSEVLTVMLQEAKHDAKEKKKLIDHLLFQVNYQKKLLDDLFFSGSWKFSSIYRFFFKEEDFTIRMVNIVDDVGISHIAAPTKSGDMTPDSVCDSDGLDGSTQLAACPTPEKSQDHDELKHQGCPLDMSSQDINNVIDLISLPLDQFIATSYNLLLGRNPEPSELRVHGSTLRAGLGRGRMLFEIHSSPEYSNRYHQTINQKSDEEFINWLYDRYIHRHPDRTGLDHYLTLLSRGVSREQVKKDIRMSSEAQSTGGLWVELDRLLEFERQQQKRSRRWIRRSRSKDRVQHQEQEALLQLGHISEERLRMRIAQVERRQLDQAAAIYRQLEEAGTNVPLEQISDLTYLPEPTSPLASVDTSDMSPEVRRIMLRLQHVKGASIMEKGRI